MELDTFILPGEWYQVVLHIMNSAAGYYAAILWGYFGLKRWQTKRRGLAVADYFMTFCSLGIGVSYTLGLLGLAPEWVLGTVGVRSLITPIIVIPVVLHLHHLKRANSFIEEAGREIEAHEEWKRSSVEEKGE